VDKISRLILQNLGEPEDQEVPVVEVQGDVDVVETGVDMVVEIEEAMEVNVGEDMETEVEDMEEIEEAADMVAVEVEIGKEDMEEVQTAMPAEVDHAEVVDMVADMVADVEAVVVAAMKEAEEEDKTAKASRPKIIR